MGAMAHNTYSKVFLLLVIIFTMGCTDSSSLSKDLIPNKTLESGIGTQDSFTSEARPLTIRKYNVSDIKEISKKM